MKKAKLYDDIIQKITNISNMDKIYQDIEDDLGIYAYNAYHDNSRHEMEEKILIAIISKIIVEFLIGLIDPKKLGEKLRIKFKELITKNRKKNKDEFLFRGQLENFLKENKQIIVGDNHFNQSKEKISNYLISDLKLPSDKASLIAAKICDDLIKNVNQGDF